MEINERIKKYRLLRSLSQQRLAEKVGLSRVALTQIERKERKVAADNWVSFRTPSAWMWMCCWAGLRNRRSGYPR